LGWWHSQYRWINKIHVPNGKTTYQKMKHANDTW
jgi:hypothetical protein